jgi:hypothetical protein
MGIRAKLLGGFGVVLALMTVITTVGVTQLDGAVKRSEATTARTRSASSTR